MEDSASLKKRAKVTRDKGEEEGEEEGEEVEDRREVGGGKAPRHHQQMRKVPLVLKMRGKTRVAALRNEAAALGYNSPETKAARDALQKATRERMQALEREVGTFMSEVQDAHMNAKYQPRLAAARRQMLPMYARMLHELQVALEEEEEAKATASADLADLKAAAHSSLRTACACLRGLSKQVEPDRAEDTVNGRPCLTFAFTAADGKQCKLALFTDKGKGSLVLLDS